MPFPFRELGSPDARICDESIDTLQFFLRTCYDILHAAVVGHVQLPYFNHTSCTAGRVLIVYFCGVALLEAADCKDQGAGSEAGHFEVAGYFFSKTNIAATHDDRFALVGSFWVWEGVNELAAEEAWRDKVRD